MRHTKNEKKWLREKSWRRCVAAKDTLSERVTSRWRGRHLEWRDAGLGQRQLRRLKGRQGTLGWQQRAVQQVREFPRLLGSGASRGAGRLLRRLPLCLLSDGHAA